MHLPTHTHTHTCVQTHHYQQLPSAHSMKTPNVDPLRGDVFVPKHFLGMGYIVHFLWAATSTQTNCTFPTWLPGLWTSSNQPGKSHLTSLGGVALLLLPSELGIVLGKLPVLLCSLPNGIQCLAMWAVLPGSAIVGVWTVRAILHIEVEFGLIHIWTSMTPTKTHQLF